jgi:hypothetical protein
MSVMVSVGGRIRVYIGRIVALCRTLHSTAFLHAILTVSHHCLFLSSTLCCSVCLYTLHRFYRIFHMLFLSYHLPLCLFSRLCCSISIRIQILLYAVLYSSQTLSFLFAYTVQPLPRFQRMFQTLFLSRHCLLGFSLFCCSLIIISLLEIQNFHMLILTHHWRLLFS